MGRIQVKYYQIVDSSGISILSEVQILEFYWDYWSTRMQECGKQSEIDPKTCIEDFCVIHWATEIEIED